MHAENHVVYMDQYSKHNLQCLGFCWVFFFIFVKISSTNISYKQVETGLKDWIRRRAEEEIAKQVEMMRIKENRQWEEK